MLNSPPSLTRMYLDSVRGVSDEIETILDGASNGLGPIPEPWRSAVEFENVKLRGLVDEHSKRLPIYPASKREAA